MEKNVKIIGYILYGVSERFIRNLNLYIQCNLNYNIKFKKIDLKIPISDQGHFDLILCKPFDILQFSTSEYEHLFKYYVDNKHKFFDSLDHILLLFYRNTMYDLIKNLYISDNNITITDPHSIKYTSISDFKKDDFIFPIIYKPLIADGSIKSHKCYIIHNIDGLSLCEYPGIFQQYYKHDGYVYKIYIIGDTIYQEIRPSISSNIDNINNLSIESLSRKTKQIISNKITYVSNNILNILIKELKYRLKLSLFGFDLLYDNEINNYYLIDINYFPSYSGFPNLNDTFASFIYGSI